MSTACPSRMRRPTMRVYLDALDIDYAALGRRQRAAAALLRSGEARVTTPAGTDIRFRVGDRPVQPAGRRRVARAHRSRRRCASTARVELPAGVLRVAPIESSVQGTLVIPKARFGTSVVTRARLEIKDGLVVEGDSRRRAGGARRIPGVGARRRSSSVSSASASIPSSSSRRADGAALLRLRRRRRPPEPRRQRGGWRRRPRRRRRAGCSSPTRPSPSAARRW